MIGPAFDRIVDKYPPEIARGTAGDCCIKCGKVGVPLPDEHGCKPNVSEEELYGGRTSGFGSWPL